MLKVIVNSLRHGIEHQRAGDPRREQPARTSIPRSPQTSCTGPSLSSCSQSASSVRSIHCFILTALRRAAMWRTLSSVASILFVVAIGQTFALVVGGFDISVGANMGFVSIVAALLMTENGSVVEGVGGGLLAGTLVGCLNGILVARFKVTPFVATLGVMTFTERYV